MKISSKANLIAEKISRACPRSSTRTPFSGDANGYPDGAVSSGIPSTPHSIPGEHTGSRSNGSGDVGRLRAPVASRTSNRPKATPTNHEHRSAANPAGSEPTSRSSSSTSSSGSASASAVVASGRLRPSPGLLSYGRIHQFRRDQSSAHRFQQQSLRVLISDFPEILPTRSRE